MNTKDYVGDDRVKCWCCDHVMTRQDFMNADGFCEECDSEIDLQEQPYIELETG